MNAFKAWWAQRAPRERTVLALGAAVVVLGLLWALAVAPALNTLRSAPPKLAALEAQLAQMRAAQAEAQRLRAQPAPSTDDARRQITQITREQLGSGAQIVWSGDTAQVRFEAVAPQALARWLQAVRQQAFATPGQMQIKPSAAAPSVAGAAAVRSGTGASDSAGTGLISGNLSIGLTPAAP